MTQITEPMKSNVFRKELKKIMPGYKWTVHRRYFPDAMEATGLVSAGFNRTSTLRVIRRMLDDEVVEYEVASSGTGLRAPWLYLWKDKTLARALRGLQDYYANMASKYNRHAIDLENGRKA